MSNTESQDQPPFAIGRVVLCLTATACVCALALGGTMTIWGDQPVGTWRALVWGGGLVWAAAVAGVLPVAAMGARGALPTAVGYFIGMAVRLLVCLGAFLIVSFEEVLPRRPFAVALVGFYVPLLWVEVAFVARYLWLKDAWVSRVNKSGTGVPGDCMTEAVV